MENGKVKLTCAQAREIDMVSYLASIGHVPQKIRGHDFWYCSPFGEDRTPSFKVNRKRNRWYDFSGNSEGKQKSGNLIDFAIRYHDCSIAELLTRLQDASVFVNGLPAIDRSEPEPVFAVSRVQAIRHHALLHYLHQRRVPLHLAEQYCHEVHYGADGRSYFGIGFKNDRGGYEIRNPFFKGCISPKAPTSIDHGAPAVCVFEGFIDFLSFLSLFPSRPVHKSNYLILNSLSLFEKARPFLERHRCVHLLLDHDSAGRNMTAYACSLHARYRDESAFYIGHHDVNEILCHFGRRSPPLQRPPRKSHRL